MKHLRAYILGYFLSLVLTFGAFGWTAAHLRTDHVLPPHEVMLALLCALAVAQLLVQLIFFLHLGDEPRPRFKLMTFFFALFVVVVLAGGTLWIMHNLSHGQHAPPKEYFTGGVVSPYTQND